MSKLQLFRDFVCERLAAAALEIFGKYEETLAEYQEEICRSNEKIAELQTPLDIALPEITPHRTDVLLFSLPEPPPIKEEQQLWTTQGGEQPQGLQSDTTDSRFASTRVKTYCDPEGSIQLPALDKTPAVKIKEIDPLPDNTTEVQIKVESDEEEDYGASAQSLEEERTGLLPELRSIPNPCSSPDTCPRTRPSPSPWTRPLTASRSGRESDDISSGEAKSKTVKRQHQCEECDKAFIHKNNLVLHRRIHTGEKPYQCDECDKAFVQRINLVEHRRIHTGEKPYQCDECDKAFTRKRELVRHRRRHTGEKPYQCDGCDKAFSNKHELVRHRRRHTGEKPYQCDECDEAFSNKNNLVRHRGIHTGDAPFQCDECGKAFILKRDVVCHRRIHTGERLYQCEECDKAFTRQNSLNRHRKIHTGKNPVC